MSIESTKNYEMFKKNTSNRELDKQNLEKIKASIEMKNLLHLRPIIVNEKMEIIDGQHRFEIAKQLNVPIYYQIQKEANEEDVFLLNVNQKSWGFNDYLNYYISLGYEDYINFKKIIDKYSISINAGFHFIYTYTDGRLFVDFRRGKLKLPPTVFIDTDILFDKYQQVKEIIKLKYIGNSRFVEGPKFIGSLFRFLARSDVNFEKFLSKLEMKLNFLKSTSKTSECLEILVSIYNFKNSEPIPLKEGGE